MIDVNSIRSYLEAAETCRERRLEEKGSRLQRREQHRVELLPSAAVRPRQGGDGMDGMDGSLSSKTSRWSLPEAAEPKPEEPSILPRLRSGKFLPGFYSGSKQTDLFGLSRTLAVSPGSPGGSNCHLPRLKVAI